VGRHHPKGLLDAQVKGAALVPGDMPTESTKATRHQAPSLRLAFLDLLAASSAAARNSSNSCCEEL
jgi:hypothetical protein